MPSHSNPQLLTNVLLIIIAALLLVQVIQNGMNSQNFTPGVLIRNSDESGLNQQPMQNGPGVPGSAAMGNDMIFSALKAFPAGCEGRTLLAECSSPAAEEAKRQILDWEQSGQSPHAIFDQITKKWGEQVLTEQALQIRKMMKKKKEKSEQHP